MTVHVLWGNGQSNKGGTANGPPAGIPLTSVGNVMYVRNIGGSRGTQDTALGPVGTRTGPSAGFEVYHGSELQCALDLYAAGLTFAIVKISRDSTPLADFLPPSGTYWSEFQSNATTAWGLIKAAFPGETFVHHLLENQGESEALNVSSTGANAWATSFRALWSALNEIVGAVAIPHVCRVNTALGSQLWLSTVRAQQQQFRYVDQDAAPGYDGIHYSAAGYNAIGALEAASILQVKTAGSLGSATKTGMVNHFRRRVTHTRAGALYLAAAVGGVEKTTNGFGRIAVTNNSTNFPAAANRSKYLAVAQSFGAVTGSTQTVDEIRLYDAPSGGNLVASWPTTASVNVGAALTVPANALQLIFQYGGLTDTVANALLDHWFGGGDYTPHATSYFVYCTSDPRAGGSEAGSRVSVANDNTVWGAPSGNAAATIVPISITDQATAHALAEYTASSGGTLVSVGTFAGAPSGNAIAAGNLVTSAA